MRFSPNSHHSFYSRHLHPGITKCWRQSLFTCLNFSRLKLDQNPHPSSFLNTFSPLSLNYMALHWFTWISAFKIIGLCWMQIGTWENYIKLAQLIFHHFKWYLWTAPEMYVSEILPAQSIIKRCRVTLGKPILCDVNYRVVIHILEWESRSFIPNRCLKKKKKSSLYQVHSPLPSLNYNPKTSFHQIALTLLT